MAHFFLLGQNEFRKTISKANVFCPFCRQEEVCKEKKLGVFVSVLFVPVYEVAALTKYYKCQACQKRFPIYARNWEQLEPRMAMQFLMLSCLIRVRMANGKFRKDPEGVAVGQQLLIFAHAVVNVNDIKERATFMKKVTGDQGLEEDLIPMVVEKLNAEQKEHILRAMAHVTLSRGKVNAKEAQVFQQAGKIFGLDDTIISMYAQPKKKTGKR